MTQTVFTYGYTSSTPADLLAFADDIPGARVLDIRFAPVSRVPRWRQDALRDLLRERYHYLHEGGNRNYRNGGPIEIVDLATTVEEVRRFYAMGLSCILLCGCREWATCHRAVVANAIAAEFGWRVVHLPTRYSADWRDGLRRCGDGTFAVATGWRSGRGTVMQARTGGQG